MTKQTESWIASFPYPVKRNFNYLFTIKLVEIYIWFSIYARPQRSQFTRCQRLSVAVSLLFCAILASVMYNDALSDGDPAVENKVGAFLFTWKQVKFVQKWLKSNIAVVCFHN